MSDHSAEIEQLQPLLPVRDIERSIEFYRELLGFALVGAAESDGRVYWCRLERGGASLMLQQFGAEAEGPDERPGGGVGFYFVCDDAEIMYEELRSRGARVERPREAYYGMNQLFVPEPDGYRICFESPTERYTEGVPERLT